MCSFSVQKALASVSWMDGNSGSGSGNVTRFELPMDLKTLEGVYVFAIFFIIIYFVSVQQCLL